MFISGNAIYNLTDPLFELILGQLEKDASTVYNSVPFDLRIGQMLAAAVHGASDSLLPFALASQEGSNFNASIFETWWREYGATSPMRQSTVIQNYGNYMCNSFIHSLFTETDRCFVSFTLSKHQHDS